MTHRSLTVLLAAASLGLSSGCAMNGLHSAWSQTMAVFRPEPKSGEDASSAESVRHFPRKGSKDTELSAEFKEAQKTFKHTEQTMLAWARYQEDVGEYAEARKKYRELLIAYPDNMEAGLGMARIELLTGRSQQAEEILVQLEKDRPNEILIKLELGRMFSQEERWTEALSKFEQASELDPTDQTSRYELGIALARGHRFDSALAHLTFAVGASAANYNIGYVLHEEGNDADAAEWFQNAMQSHPDHQTEEKTRAMLASLTPAGANTMDTSIVAQYRPRMDVPQAENSTTPAAGGVTAQFSPHSLASSDIGQPLPVVVGTHLTEGERLPPAVSHDAQIAMPPASLVTGQFPVRSASYSESGAAGSEAKVRGNNWHPQGAGSPSLGTPDSVPQTPSSQEPPLWRARESQR